MLKPHRTTLSAIAILATAASLGGCATVGSHDTTNAKPVARALLHDAQGREAGSVTLTVENGMVHGVVDVNGISPGSHGIHLHTTGKCDAPGFTTAGGHLNPDGKQHGLQNPLGAHQGDLPDVIVGADGTGHGTFIAHTTLPALFDADGAALVVHAGPDDNKTDPSGNSGGRILCGVLQQIDG
ncbi:MAG TPA: superoxide dismutase family protein [Sphingobium sp.]